MLNHTENNSYLSSNIISGPIIIDLKPVMTGLSPAFRETTTGEVHLSLDQNGELSNDHSFFHLPIHWISECAPSGEAMKLIHTIEAGYWRSTGFIALTKHIQLPLDS